MSKKENYCKNEGQIYRVDPYPYFHLHKIVFSCYSGNCHQKNDNKKIAHTYTTNELKCHKTTAEFHLRVADTYIHINWDMNIDYDLTQMKWKWICYTLLDIFSVIILVSIWKKNGRRMRYVQNYILEKYCSASLVAKIKANKHLFELFISHLGKYVDFPFKWYIKSEGELN